MDQGVAIKKQSQIKEIFKRFKKNRMAVFGLVVITYTIKLVFTQYFLSL